MNKSLDLTKLADHYREPLAAAIYLEKIRWPHGPVCPHCGENTRKPYLLSSGPRRLWKCAACRKQFSVMVGSIFERSHIPLNKWLLAFHLMCASKKGMSALQLSRMLNLTPKTAWFMAHRIRLAMKQGLERKLGGVVEVDEAWLGGKGHGSGSAHRGRGSKRPIVLALVSRDGQMRAVHFDKRLTGKNLKAAVRDHVDQSATISTDEYPGYRGIGADYRGGHHTVNHSQDEYVRGIASTNSAESFFALLKRGVHGTFHTISVKHLHRYLDEFAFRHNARRIEDGERTLLALKGAGGKRLRYKGTP